MFEFGWLNAVGASRTAGLGLGLRLEVCAQKYQIALIVLIVRVSRCVVTFALSFAEVTLSLVADVSGVAAGSGRGSAALCAKGTPYLRPPRLGPRPYTISAVNSFMGSFVWFLWLDHQPRSAFAETPLTDSALSDHDSPYAPATTRSVYVITPPATRPPRHGLGVTAPNPHAPITKAHRPPPPSRGCTVHAQGL